MLEVWRVVKRKHASRAFDGEGARRYGGRWNSPGQAVAYASGSIALATLEVLVGLDSNTPIEAYVVVPARFDADVVEVVAAEALPSQWNQFPPGQETQRMGDAWLRGQTTLALSVPSAIVPYERNYLLNPAHPAFKDVELGSPLPIEFDPRLMP